MRHSNFHNLSVIGICKAEFFLFRRPYVTENLRDVEADNKAENKAENN